MKKCLSLLLALTLVFALAGCGGGSVGYPDKDGYAEGRIGDTMHTEFFDYTVNSARVAQDYNGYTPAEGNELLVADVTIVNTFSESVTMYYDDFQAQWNKDDDDDAYAAPIEEEGLSDVQLPLEYDMAVKDKRTGELVFEVPAGNKDFSVSYLEYFDDDTTGDTFFVFFTAEKATTAA